MELLYRPGRKWVPDSEKLRTQIISGAHDSLATGHPGREIEPEVGSRASNQAEGLSDVQKAQVIASKLQQAIELAQASMAESQQEQERQANKTRREAQNFRKNAKYTVIRVVDSHLVELDTPPGPHPVFHVDRLKLASTDPLPSQDQDDSQPQPLQVDREDEWEIEDIVAEEWKGFYQTTLELAELLKDAEAVDCWEAFTEAERDGEGRLLEGFRRGDVVSL
ncbi:hypothetical protein DDE82_008756 [Stemphylium lycopersici]|uniref:Uncharacterized protein n=1 Tax=Stemphylium lycopersici TaxID=183478 RepID=A0A364MS73_STELY|nr:hypothetical protein DDE82_008756 [Stemphylium lycopersici]RAR01247.1 hypothetical protein DDE83_008955 [Stemphylium lycopersici]